MRNSRILWERGNLPFWIVLVAAVPPALCGCRQAAPTVAEAPPPEVSVMQPLVSEVADDFEDTGQTAAVEEVEIRARVSGYLVKKHVPDGAEVKKNQVLYTVDPLPYQAALERARADVDRWKATLDRAVAELERTRKLLPSGAATQADYELNVAQVKLNTAELHGAEASVKRADLDLGWTEVKAPLDGRVGRCNFSEGDLVPVGNESQATVLTTIVSTRSMWVYFNVPERTMLAHQQQVRESGHDTRPENVKDLKWPVFIGLANEEGYPHSGILDFVDNRVDPQTGTIRVRGIFDNADRWLTAGLFVRVRLPIDEPKPALLVPERAIGTDQGQKYLLAVGAADVVERLPVVLGRQTKPEGATEVFRVISSGLAPGRRVIVNGIQRARVGAKVSPKTVAAPAGSTPAAQGPKA